MTIADQIRARLDAVTDERRKLDEEERRLRAALAMWEGAAPVPTVVPFQPLVPSRYIQPDGIHWMIPFQEREQVYCGGTSSTRPALSLL